MAVAVLPTSQRLASGSSALCSLLRLRRVLQKTVRDGVQVDDLTVRVRQIGGARGVISLNGAEVGGGNC